jgi:phosphatidate cytidylyltransferase
MIISRGLLGIVFIGFFGSHLVMLWSLPDGAHWLIILTAVTAGSDTCAYWVGSRWGKRKLCPNISPNKTVEGAAGGIAGGMLIGLLFFLLLDVKVGFLTILAIGCFLSITGMFGDLLESIIKRGTNTKDSGTILRGHGGVLDRTDSLLMSAPVLYCMLVCMGL